MKKTISFIFSLVFIVLSMLSINLKTVKAVSTTDVENEINNIVVPERAIIDFPVVSVSAYGSTITWESDNVNAINVPTNGGWAKVTRLDVDTTVTLKVTLTNGEISLSKEFSVLVPKGETYTNSYRITYVLNGGENATDNPTSYKVGERLTLKAPTKGVLSFLGWYDNEAFEGEAITTLPNGLSGDYTLYAKWAEREVTKIIVVTNPTKTVYNAKETFDMSGLVVEKVYNYGDNEVVDLSQLSFDKTTLHFNDTKVVVSYESFSAKIDITVNKINYDLSGVLFENKTVTYNGLEQTINFEGILPEGLTGRVSRSYKDAGENLEVTLEFTSSDLDYNTPASKTAYLTIKRAPLTVTVISKGMKVGSELPQFDVSIDGFVNGEAKDVLDMTGLTFNTLATSQSPAGSYDVTASGIKTTNYEITYVLGTLTISSGSYQIVASALEVTYDGTLKMFSVKVFEGETELPISNFVYTLNGEPFNGAKNAGTYNVKVEFNDPTYGTGEHTFTFKINKAKYDMSGISFVPQSVVYNGELQNLVINGTLPTGVSVRYTEGLVNVGEKVIEAIFTGDEANYETISSLKATLTVTPLTLTDELFEQIEDVAYTGLEVKPEVVGKFNGTSLIKDTDFTLVYSNNIEKGTANIEVTGMGNFKGTITLHFVIGDSDLEKVVKARNILLNKYETVLTGKLTSVITSLDVKVLGNVSVDWLSSTTAFSVQSDGKVTTILTNQPQTVTVFAVITLNDAADYASFTFTLPTIGNAINPETGITVIGVGSTLTLDVQTLTSDVTSTFDVKENEEVVVAYDINLMDGTTKVEPTQKVVVRIPVPTEKADDNSLQVYYVNGTVLENMNATIETIDGVKYLVFETTHFSSYVITCEKQEEIIVEKTIEEILALPVGEEYYQVTGIVKNIKNPTYGNFDLVDINDQNISIYVYGLLTGKNGESKKFQSLNISEGDILVLVGKRAEYNKTAQIGDAYYVSHTKQQFNVSISVEDDTLGAATLSSTKVFNGEKVTLTFEPKEGYKISKIKVNGNDLVVTSNTHELTITSDTVIVVYFIEESSGVSVVASFDFGENKPETTEHKDGSIASSYTDENNGYTLNLTGCNNVYKDANDVKGNSCLKLGTSKKAGSFSFSVSADVTQVIIYVATYKDKTASIKINDGVAINIDKLSNNGEYQAIVIDTTTVKDISFVVSSGFRCMIDKIEFYK